MFNLLPEIEKKQIVSEYNTRRTIVALIFLFALGLIAVISIIPSFILSSLKVSDVSQNISSVRQSTIFKEEAELTSALSETNSKISILYSKEDPLYIGDLFLKTLSHKGDSIRINGIEYGRRNDSGSISLSGVARSREDLSFFVESMKKDLLFKEVKLPVSNFAKDQNAQFTIDIMGDF